MSNTKTIKALLEGCLSVPVRGKNIDLTPPRFNEIMSLNDTIQEAGEGMDLSDQAVLCLEACLPEDDLSEKELRALIAISGGVMGELCMTAFDLCGFPLRQTLDESRDETPLE